MYRSAAGEQRALLLALTMAGSGACRGYGEAMDLSHDMSDAAYFARFQPEWWIDDEAVPVDPAGRTEWDCTEFMLKDDGDMLEYITDSVKAGLGELNSTVGVLDSDDKFIADPAAPQWAREWNGPFTIRVFAGKA